jgi:hypothetical protein
MSSGGTTAAGGGASGGGTSGGGGERTGTVAVRLTVDPVKGVQLLSLGYTISGPGLPTYTGTDSIGPAQAVGFVVGGIQPGSPYTVTLSGADTAGDPCTGTSGPFTVTAGMQTGVSLLVTCTVPTDASLPADVNTGGVGVDASVVLTSQSAYSCPGITSFSISPAEIACSGQQAALAVMTTDPTGTIVWSTSPPGAGLVGADGGTDTSDPNVFFTCGTLSGTVTVTASVELDVVPLGSDGGPVNVCDGVPFTSMSGTVRCECP